MQSTSNNTFIPIRPQVGIERAEIEIRSTLSNLYRGRSLPPSSSQARELLQGSQEALGDFERLGGRDTPSAQQLRDEITALGTRISRSGNRFSSCEQRPPSRRSTPYHALDPNV